MSTFMNMTKTEVTDQPIYVHWRKITVWGRVWRAMVISIFFDVNPGYLCGIGHHAADVERLFVLYDDAGDPAHVYFGAHSKGHGVWRKWGECEFTPDGMLKVHVAKQSHALYPTPGTYVRALGLLNDKCPSEVAWIPKAEDMHDAATQSWSHVYQVTRGINTPLYVSAPVEYSITPADRRDLLFASVRKMLAALPLCASERITRPFSMEVAY